MQILLFFLSFAVFLFIPFLLFLSLLPKAFLVWMLVDCINRDEKTLKDRNFWLVLLVLGFFLKYELIMSLIYFFSVKLKLDRKK
ncbi:MAG: hypothetical protein WCY00_01545 [Candidatus Dojkabacteria bacterium]